MIDKRLNSLATANPTYLLLFIGLGIIGGVLAVAQAYYFATIVDQAFLKGQSLAALQSLLLILLVILIGRGILSFTIACIGSKLAGEIKLNIRRMLLEKLLKIAPGFLVEEKTGQLVSVLTDGVDQLEVYFSRYLPQLVQAMTIPVIVLIVVFSKSIFSGAIMLITAPLIPFFMVIIGNMAENKTREQLGSMLRFSGFFLDVLQGLTTLKLFGQSKNKGQEIAVVSEKFRDSTMEVLKIAFLSALMLEILATISTAMIAVEVGLRLLYGHHSFHTAFFILLLAPELYTPLKNMGSSFHAGRSSISAAQKVWEVLEEKGVQVQWGSEALEGGLPPEIELKDISFSYHLDKEILSGISLIIKPGEKIALVGKSGSGKTTLIKLIMGLLPPDKGQVLINGKPLSNVAEERWFGQLAYVSQEPYLFAGSIADNILLGNQTAEEGHMAAAVAYAGVDRFIDRLPAGLNTIIGEGGYGLSGGEKQRIAMARAFVKNARLVFLDEPTSHLDMDSEQAIKKAIEILKRERTIITVAHRLETVIDADKIIVLDKGTIASAGTHEELLKSSDIYRQIFELKEA